MHEALIDPTRTSINNYVYPTEAEAAVGFFVVAGNFSRTSDCHPVSLRFRRREHYVALGRLTLDEEVFFARVTPSASWSYQNEAGDTAASRRQL